MLRISEKCANSCRRECRERAESLWLKGKPDHQAKIDELEAKARSGSGLNETRLRRGSGLLCLDPRSEDHHVVREDPQ